MRSVIPVRGSWLYPGQLLIHRASSSSRVVLPPVRVSASTLWPILSAVMTLLDCGDTPWMVHSVNV
jgi:hypothetical protein